jgi:hypothetical protein
MSSTHLIIPDQHAHPEFNNNRADLLAKLIKDVRPDVVVNIGDAADMPSMSSYDKGTKGFQGRSYRKDINSHLEFQDRLWAPVKRSKKRLPHRVVLEGNHEHRVKRAINASPELDGAISFDDFDFKSYYDEVVEYNGGTPGVVTIDGVSYAHYFISGVACKPISGEHQAYTLLTKQFTSCTQGHTHTTDFAMRTDVNGRRMQGLVVGVYQDYVSEWAGEANRMWWSGVVVKRNVEDGHYDPQWISLEALEKEYG